MFIFFLFRLELHLVGGFDDDNKMSHKLSCEILGMEICTKSEFTCSI